MSRTHGASVTIVTSHVKLFLEYRLGVLSGHIDLVCANVSRILREEREKQSLSMTSVAKKAGLSRAMISFVERDLRTPSLETLLRITAALELDLGEVIHSAFAAAKRGK